MFRIIACACCLVALPACSVSSRAYVRSQVGFEVCEGRVIGLEGVPQGRRETLVDGVVVHVESPGCVAVLRRPDRTRVLPLGVGSRVVFGGELDFVLLKGGSAGVDEVTPPDSGAVPAGVPVAVEMPLERAVGLADRALELLDAGQPEDAREVLGELGASSDSEPGERALRALVERRLETVRVASGSRPDSAPDPVEPDGAEVDPVRSAAARRLLLEGRLQLEAGSSGEALELLEQASELDPGAPEVVVELASLLERMGLAAYSTGRTREAIEFWERGAALRPGDQELRRYLERARRVEQAP